MSSLWRISARCMADHTSRNVWRHIHQPAGNWCRLNGTALRLSLRRPREASSPSNGSRCFSKTTQNLHRIGTNLNKQNWPGFRNETRESRTVREHGLFDPYAPATAHAFQGSTSRGGKRTTLPITLTPSEQLESELLFRATQRPPGPATRTILEHLIVERGEPPNVAHYETLILLNAWAAHGSAENVARLLNEMDRINIAPNVNIYTAVLKALVVHPDLGLLQRVIMDCDKMWIEIDQEMRHLICAIHLRADIIELAFDDLDQIEGKEEADHAHNGPRKAELWLYVMLLRQLALRDDWDAVLRLCYRLHDDTSLGIPFAMRQIDVPYDFWHWLLEKAAAAGDEWVTMWIWDLWVVRKWIEPAPKLCEQVLALAADRGLIPLAYRVAAIIRAGGTSDFKPTWKRDWVGQQVEKAWHTAGRRKPQLFYKPLSWKALHWELFKDDSNFEQEFDTKMRLDPWAMLTEFSDPGRAWPRIQRQKQELKDHVEKRLAGAAAARAERNKQRIMREALAGVPGQLIQDAETVASIEPPDPALFANKEDEA